MTMILPALWHLRVGLTEGGQTSDLQITNAVPVRPRSRAAWFYPRPWRI